MATRGAARRCAPGGAGLAAGLAAALAAAFLVAPAPLPADPHPQPPETLHAGTAGTAGTGADTLTLEDLEGRWLGTLQLDGEAAPRLGIRILRKADGSMGASSASVDQGAAFIPSTAELEGRTLTVQMEGPGITVRGTVGPELREIDAALHQGEASLPLPLRRVDELPPAGEIRPQTPRPPHPYRAEEVRFQNREDDVWLAGTLTAPEGHGPHPAAVLLAGSGPQDRGVTGSGGHQLQAVVADHLTRSGFAVLRYDKRGVYRSAGSYGDATQADFARDAAAAVRYLRSRDDVRSDAVGLVGHSEGSLLAARVAAGDPELAFLVSLAGPGLPLYETLVLQDGTQAAADGATEAEVELIREFSRKYYRTALETEGQAAREEALAALYDSLQGRQRAVMDEFFPDRPGTLDPSFAARDAFVADLEAPGPARYWHRVGAPVLVLNGGLDSQVPARENVSAITEALEEAPTDRVESRVFPGLNHRFQTAQTGAVDEYRAIEETIAPEVLRFVARWLREVE